MILFWYEKKKLCQCHFEWHLLWSPKWTVTLYVLMILPNGGHEQIQYYNGMPFFELKIQILIEFYLCSKFRKELLLWIKIIFNSNKYQKNKLWLKCIWLSIYILPIYLFILYMSSKQHHFLINLKFP